jgi:hypothetical protein
LDLGGGRLTASDNQTTGGAGGPGGAGSGGPGRPGNPGQGVVPGLFVAALGTLTGPGTVDGDVTNAGTVAVGSAGTPGILTVTGDYTQTATATLTVQIGGPGTAGADFDQLNVCGQASLAGTLRVTLINGYTPASGDSIPVLTCGAARGRFWTLIGDGRLFRATYDPNDVTLVAI